MEKELNIKNITEQLAQINKTYKFKYPKKIYKSLL